jgi:hypothetical protein
MNRFRPRLTYANVVSTLCLFILLGGGAWAATQLPANSVGSKQLRDNSVGKHKLKRNSVGDRALSKHAVGPSELKPTAQPPLFVHIGYSGIVGEQRGVVTGGRLDTGQYYADFDRDLTGCVAVASVGFGFGVGVVGAGRVAHARMDLDNNPARVGITVYKSPKLADVDDSDVNVIVAC